MFSQRPLTFIFLRLGEYDGIALSARYPRGMSGKPKLSLGYSVTDVVVTVEGICVVVLLEDKLFPVVNIGDPGIDGEFDDAMEAPLCEELVVDINELPLI